MDGYQIWRQRRVIRLGAGLAYYALSGIVPILALVLAVVGLVFDEADLEEFLSDRLGELLGSEVDTIEVV